MPKLAASASAFLEEACSLSPESAGFRSTGRHRSGDFLTSFKETETPVWFKDPDKFSPWTWRKQHNYFLDRGAKFMMVYKTPTIVSTDLFDLEKYGCFQVRGFQDTEGITSYISHVVRSAVGMQKEHIKKWWIHPRIEFNSPVSRIGVRLQDLTTGELRWDAIYDLGKAAWKARNATEESTCPEDGWHLCEDEEPVGGEHPFFAPDWCPGPNDGMSHKYLLTVSNLSSRDSPEQPLVGEMLFTQYGVNQLDNTYSFEMHAPLSLTDQAYFTAVKGAREAAATARMTGRVGGPEGLATQVDRGKVPHEMDKLKELQKFEPPKDMTSAPEMAKSKLDKSQYSKMLDNKDFAKTLA